MRMMLLTLLAFGVSAAACGSETHTGTAESQRTGPAPAARTDGWSIRDAVPYPRMGHSAVLDDAMDRMIVLGGGANDIWALPLSGPNEGQWAELLTRGPHPPAHAYGDFGADSAVYDPVGQRMIVAVDRPFVTSSNDTSLWQLSLDAAPEWNVFAASPSVLVNPRLALDADGRRLFLIGDHDNQLSLWSLSLDGPAMWTALPDQPWGFVPNGDAGASMVYDAAQDRLLLRLVRGEPYVEDIWALSLADETWTLLVDAAPSSGSGSMLLDATGGQLVVSSYENVVVRSANDGEPTRTGVPYPDGNHEDESAVVDGSRRRVLYFGGRVLSDSTNEYSNSVSALDLDGLTWSEVAPASITLDSATPPASVLAYDPERGSVMALLNGATLQYARDGSVGWTPVATTGTPPADWLQTGFYDAKGHAVVAFDGPAGLVARLGSAAGATWEALFVGAGPGLRSDYAAAYDSARDRLVIHGGQISTGSLADLWALSLVDKKWTRLEPDGPAPVARYGQVAVSDTRGGRMLTYGGSTYNEASGEIEQLTDLWALSLDGAPRWTALAATGEGPGPLSDGASAIYEAERRRMIIVDFRTLGDIPDNGVARVFALELDGEPAWHRFCSPGVTPANNGFGVGRAVLTPDGLFLAMWGGAFRFGLGTAYCDGSDAE